MTRRKKKPRRSKALARLKAKTPPQLRNASEVDLPPSSMEDHKSADNTQASVYPEWGVTEAKRRLEPCNPTNPAPHRISVDPAAPNTDHTSIIRQPSRPALLPSNPESPSQPILTPKRPLPWRVRLGIKAMQYCLDNRKLLKRAGLWYLKTLSQDQINMIPWLMRPDGIPTRLVRVDGLRVWNRFRRNKRTPILIFDLPPTAVFHLMADDSIPCSYKPDCQCVTHQLGRKWIAYHDQRP